MTLDEFEALCEKATREWTSGYVPVSKHNHWRSVGPVTFGMEQAVCDADFTLACREMVPRMIKALKAANALHMRFVHDETNTVKDSVTFLRLSMTLADLEQP